MFIISFIPNKGFVRLLRKTVNENTTFLVEYSCSQNLLIFLDKKKAFI